MKQKEKVPNVRKFTHKELRTLLERMKSHTSTAEDVETVEQLIESYQFTLEGGSDESLVLLDAVLESIELI